jgi:hypothetical protein
MEVVAPKEPLPSQIARHIRASSDSNFFSIKMLSALQGGALRFPGPLSKKQLMDYFTDPEQVLERQEKALEQVFFGGEAVPIVYPVSINLPVLSAAYLGSSYSIHPNSCCGWSEASIPSWNDRAPIRFDRDSKWWRITARLLEAGAERAGSRYQIGIPDLNSAGEILSRLRGTEPFCIDLIEHPEEVKTALREINDAWYEIWKVATGILHPRIEGYLYWLGLWSRIPSTDLQCDVSALISNRMFEQYIVPTLEWVIERMDRTIYHLDGPDAIQHLDSLLELPGLNGIQWVAGAGAPPTPAWIPQLKRIQAAKKLLVIYSFAEEVETLLSELDPRGLLICVGCETEEQARLLLKKAEKWSAGG